MFLISSSTLFLPSLLKVGAYNKLIFFFNAGYSLYISFTTLLLGFNNESIVGVPISNTFLTSTLNASAKDLFIALEPLIT